MKNIKDNIVIGQSENPVIGNEVRDRRSKKVSGFSGLSIEFKSVYNLLIGDFVYAKFINSNGDTSSQTFEIVQQWLNGDDIVNVAIEKGYYAHHISKNNKFILTDFNGIDVYSITDEKLIENIRQSSLWC